MARFARRSSNLRRGPRRVTEWVGGENVLSAPTGLSENSTTIHMVQTAPPVGTIIRCRGYFKGFTDQNTDTQTPFGAIGIAVVTANAFAAGVAAIPAPYSDSGSEKWLYHAYWGSHIQRAGAASGDGVTLQIADIEIDSKAMRKVTGDDVIVFMVENQSALDAMLYLFNVRMLFKLA